MKQWLFPNFQPAEFCTTAPGVVSDSVHSSISVSPYINLHTTISLTQTSNVSSTKHLFKSQTVLQEGEIILRGKNLNQHWFCWLALQEELTDGEL